jgi:hypothetical protein
MAALAVDMVVVAVAGITVTPKVVMAPVVLFALYGVTAEPSPHQAQQIYNFYMNK